MRNVILFFLILSNINTVFLKRSEMEGYVVGGEYANRKQFPYVVYLTMDCENEKENFFCGSSVINQNILLTAAHCLVDCEKHAQIDCLAGGVNLKEMTVKRRTSIFYINPFYDGHTNDIALVGLKSSLPLSSTINRVSITHNFEMTSHGFVAGWGITNEQKQTDTTWLKFSNQRVKRDSFCNKVTQGRLGDFCAASTDKSWPSIGDSGSGLVINKIQIIGIVAYRVQNRPNTVIYTNVSHYYNWIKQRSARLFCQL